MSFLFRTLRRAFGKDSRRQDEDRERREEKRRARSEAFGRHHRPVFLQTDEDIQHTDRAMGERMIKLTRLSGETIYLNFFQILFMERIPETKIKLTNGDYYLVKESVEEVNEQIQKFFRKSLTYLED